jgi:hypothetical protein
MTAALARAAVRIAEQWQALSEIHAQGTPEAFAESFAYQGLDGALDVDELTEILAREQWNSLPLVSAGGMIRWESELTSEIERASFRDRVRPFAVAIRAGLLGEGS